MAPVNRWHCLQRVQHRVHEAVNQTKRWGATISTYRFMLRGSLSVSFFHFDGFTVLWRPFKAFFGPANDCLRIPRACMRLVGTTGCF